MEKDRALVLKGPHGAIRDARTGNRGGAITSMGIDMMGVKVEAEFDRTSSKTLHQRLRGRKIRKKETDEIKKARKLSKEGLAGLADLLQRVQIEQYTNAADISKCREAWEDSVRASYRDHARKQIDKFVFKKLVNSTNSSSINESMPQETSSPSNVSSNNSLIEKLSEEIIELVDERRAQKMFWFSLFQVPVGHDENGVRRRTLEILGARMLRTALDKQAPISYADTSGCYYRSRGPWDGTDKRLFSENDWPLPLSDAARNIEQTGQNWSETNIKTRENINLLLDTLPVPIRNIVMNVVTSVDAKKWNVVHSDWVRNLPDAIREELKDALREKGVKEWEAPSRAIASICMLIVSVEHGNIRFNDAKGLLTEISRRVFVCYIRETARDLVRKQDSMLQLADLEKQTEALSTMVGSQLVKLPVNLTKSANELRALGFELSTLLEDTSDKLIQIESDRKALYRNMEYGAYFIYENINSIDEARELFATCLILMRVGSVQIFDCECQEEAQRRQKCGPPQVDATYVYNESRAARSVTTKWGSVSIVSHALNEDHMRSAFLSALDGRDTKGYRAMVLEGGGIFVIEYLGTTRCAWVNIGSGTPWLITGGEQRSTLLGAKLNPVMLVWRDFVLPIVSGYSEVRMDSMVEQIGTGKIQEIFPNLAFEVTASLLGRGWTLVTGPGLESSAFKVLNLDRKTESYGDYLKTKDEKGPSHQSIRTVIVDCPIRMDLEATFVHDKLRCGKDLEYVIDGYWKGDSQSHCTIKRDTSSADKRYHLSVIGQLQNVNALFE